MSFTPAAIYTTKCYMCLHYGQPRFWSDTMEWMHVINTGAIGDSSRRNVQECLASDLRREDYLKILPRPWPIMIAYLMVKVQQQGANNERNNRRRSKRAASWGSQE